jgi:hypothetical protein
LPAAPTDLSGIEGRLAALERANRADGGTAAASEAPMPPQQTPEEAHKTALAMMDQREARFRAEGADPKWAPQASQSFRRDLERLGAAVKGQVTDVECRMSMCKAKVRWDSYGDAQKNWDKLLHASYEHNCGREVFIPRPDGATGAYEGTAYYDCTSDRAGGT